MRYGRLALVAFVAAVVVAAGLYAGGLFTPTGLLARTGQPEPVIEAPRYWVPFTADVRVVDQGHKGIGTFARSSDGSTRLEIGPEDRSVWVISIYNAAQGKTFVANTRRPFWVSFPAPRHATPSVMKANSPSLDPTPTQFEGYEVYRYRTQTDTELLRAPSLNFFSLSIKTPAGRLEEYYNIKRTDSAAELFLPPAGVEMKPLNDPSELMTVNPPPKDWPNKAHAH
jgi:hypothetical protein